MQFKAIVAAVTFVMLSGIALATPAPQIEVPPICTSGAGDICNTLGLLDETLCCVDAGAVCNLDAGFFGDLGFGTCSI